MPIHRPINPEELDAYKRALGAVVYELRQPLGNQDDFADMVGVYRSHMGQIENGKLDLRYSTLLALARALKLPPSHLLQKVEERLQAGNPAPTKKKPGRPRKQPV